MKKFFKAVPAILTSHRPQIHLPSGRRNMVLTHQELLINVKPQTVQRSCQVLLLAPYAGGMHTNACTGKAWRCGEHWQMQKLNQLPHLACVPLTARHCHQHRAAV